MSFPHWRLPAETIFQQSKVIPVIVIKELAQAIPLAEALFSGGMEVLEITLRTPVALDAIKLLVKQFPDAFIGAGTIRTVDELTEVADLGAKFAISPGTSSALLEAGKAGDIALIPGVSTVSELMEGFALGYKNFKFFPAAAAGGIPMLRAIYGPFPEIKFCPTGGIHGENYADYLALPNVSCVGGSWIVPTEAIENEDWSFITDAALAVQRKKEEISSNAPITSS